MGFFRRSQGRSGQIGGGRIGAIIGLLVVASVAYLIFKWVPPRTQNAEFKEVVERMVRQHVVNEISEDQLLKGILEQAAKEGIPIGEDDVVINRYEDRIEVKGDYALKVRLIGGKIWVQKYDIDVSVPKL